MIDKKLTDKKQRGFSMIELMIAMLIGVLMLLAATGLFMSNKRIYNEQNEMGRLQENARFTIDLLNNDIRMAGYGGCLDDLTALTNSTINAGTGTNLHNSTNAIEGINGKTAVSTWSPSGSTEQRTSITNGTDSITLRYLEPIPSQAIFTTEKTADNTLFSPPPVITIRRVSTSWGVFSVPEVFNPPATKAIPTTCYNATGTVENCSASHITANENIAISNCNVGDIIIAMGTTNTTITHGATLSTHYDDSAQISRYVTTRYYIGTAANTNQVGDAVPALFRYTSVAGVATEQELIEGVERMEILYGVDTDATPDGIPDSYLRAGATGLTTAAHWNTVVSVKVTLLVRTIDENVNIDRDTSTYSLLDATAYDPVDERLRRRTYITTVQIRNRAS